MDQLFNTLLRGSRGLELSDLLRPRPCRHKLDDLFVGFHLRKDYLSQNSLSPVNSRKRTRRSSAPFCLFNLHLMLSLPRGFRPADEEIENRTENVQKDEHENPNHFFAVRYTLVADGVNQHAQPENEVGHPERGHEQEE